MGGRAAVGPGFRAGFAGGRVAGGRAAGYSADVLNDAIGKDYIIREEYVSRVAVMLGQKSCGEQSPRKKKSLGKIFCRTAQIMSCFQTIWENQIVFAMY